LIEIALGGNASKFVGLRENGYFEHEQSLTPRQHPQTRCATTQVRWPTMGSSPPPIR
jgi:hypothetical protein